MEGYQKIKIDNIEYYIIDSIQDFRAEDSFIHRTNKLAQFRGNGESKKHIGTYAGQGGRNLSNFFGYDSWGTEYIDRAKNRKTFVVAKEFNAVVSEERCFFSKSNLLKYLKDARNEYMTKEQIYHQNISDFYEDRLNSVEALNDDYIYFSIYDASDNLSQRQNRGYIRSDDSIWALWRQLILPKISYLSILKLVPSNPENEDQTPRFYFRILLDYQFRSFVHPNALEVAPQEIEIAQEIEENKKNYRIGQNAYRLSVIEHMVQCPFSKISDERLLIASHIKPYSVCIKENKVEEAIDYLNGLALSPTYDRLFDQGYITFTDNGELICGTQLSNYTWSKLNINPTARPTLRIFPENREEYLEYHRRNVFLDNIDDLI